MQRRTLLPLFPLAALAALTACGGGGGDASAPSPAPAPLPPPNGSLRRLDTSAARAEHASVVMPDGEVLAIGGSAAGESSPSQQVIGFRRASERFVERGELLTGRFLHTATAVSAHQVLVAGGQRSVSNTPLAELFDLRSGRSAPTPQAPDGPRHDHSATALGDGRVLLIGGRRSFGTPPRDDAELFDLATGRFTPLPGRLLQGRHGHGVVALDAQRLLVFGGRTSGGAPALPEVLDLATMRFDAAPLSWIEPAPRSGMVALRSAGGHALLIGGVGGDDAPLPGLVSVQPATTPLRSEAFALRQPRARLAAAALVDGRVLITGGMVDMGTQGSASTELFDPTTGRSAAGPTMASARWAHSAERLPDGSVLIFGGYDGAGYATSVELFS
ncbi:Kelch repeat-containing protein [Aquabacterium humicola]|uniref:Kelch repeat-containing protein n=1 Tax=Aquabacterium humicola TaxID=3237377 RepID=UPI00254382BD|nr:kelch repeat-containing protein [Rubrivivax pictus]